MALQKKKIVLSVALALSLIQAEAAEAEPGEAPEVQQVTVTATRRAQGIQAAPVAVTALSADTIKDDELRVINDVTRYVPNFTGQSTEGRERPRWFLRGVGSNDPSTTSLSPVGFYADDVYINSVFGQGTPLFDVGRIEVLRGPQGTLWGKNTIGGAINILSKRPEFTPGGYAKIGFGNNNSNIVEAAGGGALVPEQLAGRISLYHEQGDSEINNRATGRRFGGFEDDAVRAQLLLQTAPGNEVLLNLHGRQYHGGGNPWAVAGVDHHSVALNARNSDEIATAGANLTANWQLGNGVGLTSITAYEHVERTLFGDGDYTAAELDRGRSTLASGQWSQELRLTSSPQQQLSWIAGLHLFRENLGSAAADGTLPGTTATAFQLNTFQQRTTSAALFGSATYQVSDAFDLTAGLRWTQEKKNLVLDGYSGSNVAFSNLAQWWNQSTSGFSHDLAQNRSDTWSAPTWDLSPVYRISPTQRVFGRVARGFRSGGYNTAALSNAAFRTVTPEYLTSYEAGYKSEWLRRSVIFNATAFHYDYKDIQVFALAPSSTGSGTVSTLSNAGQGKSQGLELELKVQPTEQFGFYTNIGLLRTRFDQFANVPTAVGNSFARAPRRTANAGVDYKLALGADQLTLRGDVSYRSREYFSATRQTNPLLWQNGYSLLNFNATYSPAGGKVDVTAFVHNAGDKSYLKLALIPSYGNTPQLYGDGRSYGVTASVKF
ncbi:TonB-dependent receptor [Duganella sp. FT135W]|uniref:TonB-dependent receptor n=1 Tax=Duganella flavida TaxID=2692175 RepID=A0A6L8K5P0_9BURK|nr:TonB-dependent receptor [Duganella flavida]MYM22716.1 TonB-dependent receptor [Duganella flavida]